MKCPAYNVCREVMGKSVFNCPYPELGRDCVKMLMTVIARLHEQGHLAPRPAKST